MIDSMLSLEELKKKYPNGHPELSMDDWSVEFADGEIGLDYWSWVMDELKGYNIQVDYLKQQKEFNNKFGINVVDSIGWCSICEKFCSIH